jgi:hypothetical protein
LFMMHPQLYSAVGLTTRPVNDWLPSLSIPLRSGTACSYCWGHAVLGWYLALGPWHLVGNWKALLLIGILVGMTRFGLVNTFLSEQDVRAGAAGGVRGHARHLQHLCAPSKTMHKSNGSTNKQTKKSKAARSKRPNTPGTHPFPN